MPERKALPQAEPPRDGSAPEAPASDEPLVPQPRWRRPTLLVAGASLLTLGAFVNADRIGLGSDESAIEETEQPPVAQTRHAGKGGKGGEEGKMGKPSPRQASGAYAMKGPKDAVPQMARSFDPSYAQGPFAVGDDDADVWGGLAGSEGGSGQPGIIGLGNVGARARGDGERYDQLARNAVVQTAVDPKSTFSIDVDTASYSNVRRFLLRSHQLPPLSSVRTEELINYFDYDYAAPSGDAPFSLTTEVGPCPWNPESRLVHVGVQGKQIAPEATPPRNLVFLIDVSGSMSSADKLPLIKHGLAGLVEQLGADDRVSLVVYAGAAGEVLAPTSGADKQRILDALDRLEAGGSTNGGEGIELAYGLAKRSFIEGGINRVILASDGDFNVGTSSHDALVAMVEQKRESGVFLSVLGVGTGNLNDHMMEQIADKGNGNYAYIDGMFEARKVLVEQSSATLVTIAKDVKIQVEFDPDQVTQHRLIGYENRVMAHHEFDDDHKDAGEIGAGHTVTALYEIELSGQARDDDEPMMMLNLRYKQPDGERSRKLSVEVRSDDQALTDTSNDYRFSAAVAAFGEGLRGAEALPYAEILDLAKGSLGDDPYCYRHQFLELVWSAAQLSGEQVSEPESHCEVHEPTTSAQRSGDGEGWQAFALEVLRLLPPFLALPLFVMAMRRPRRKRWSDGA